MIESLNKPAVLPAKAEQQKPLKSPVGVEVWLLCSATLSATGWILSAFGQLNGRGYALALIVALGAFLFWRKESNISDLKGFRIYRLVRRFRKPLPLGFLLLACLSLVGGLLYLPTNYDALAYRVPRVLHWLEHGHWHWVHTAFNRLNVRACGYEWLMSPLLALTGSTRLLFLPSIISFLLLPGLLFSVFKQFGVKPRVAWHWMWIAATGYGYVTQAGSIANDLLGATYALAAFHFGLRLRLRGQSHDLQYFIIATGLLTGAKASNFPLLLPLFLLFCPRWKLLFVQPAKNFFVIAFAALASFLPTAILNLRHAHDWTGMNLEGPMKSPVAQFGINVTNWFIQNLAPPIFPFAGQWDKWIGKIPGLSLEALRSFGIPELAVEETSGLGVGLVLLLIISALASGHLRRKSGIRPVQPRANTYWKWVLWSPVIALAVFAFKAQAVHSATRLIIPYYAVLMVPCLLFSFDARLLRRGWWNSLVAIVFGMAILLIILAPARPLWPANTILANLKQSHPSSKLIARVESVYSIYQNRANGFAPLVAALPKDANVFGLFTFDDPETSLWWPLGSRRIEHVTPEDTREQLISRGIRYVLAPAYNSALAVSADDLIKKYDAKVVAKVPLLLRSVPGKMDWCILDINAKADAAQVAGHASHFEVVSASGG